MTDVCTATPDEPCKCGRYHLKHWWASITDAGNEGTDHKRHSRDECLTLTERDAKRLVAHGSPRCNGHGPYAIRLYVDGEGTGSLLCREPDHECPQWWYKPENRYRFPTPQEALAFLGTIRGEWPEFKEDDARVVRVIPPQQETYAEVRMSEPVTLEE